MRTTTWRVALACAIPVVLAGCNGSAPSASGPATSTFTIAMESLTNSMEPSAWDNASHRFALDPVKATLVQYKDYEQTGGKVPGPADMEPALATTYEVGADGITMTLGTAKSAAGNTLSPEDVKYTFERVVGVKDTVGTFLMTNAGIDPANPVTITGEHEVRINAKPTALSLLSLDAYNFAILDSTVVESHATAGDPWASQWLTTNTAMFGAYTVTAFTPGTSVAMEANPNYDGELGYPKVVIQAVPDAAARVVLAKTGKAQMVAGLPLATIKTLAADPAVKVVTTPTPGQDFLELNKNFAPFKDPAVRRAISQALDRTALAAGPYSGLATPATSIVASTINAQNSTSPYFQHDIEAAKAALAAAGQSNLTFTITTNSASISSVPVDSLLTTLQQQLAAVGITVEVATVPAAADFTAGYRAGKYEAFIRVESPVAADPVFLLNAFHSTKGVSNYANDDDPAVDAAIAAATPLSGDERLAAIAPGIASANDLMPDVPLVELTNQYIYPASVCLGTQSNSRWFDPAVAAPC
ncbi:ABC transporter substrate-binding protein [Actinoplanes rectilineatus]|uniref:ABC transporter substrate-binding protein n=1 Tax=Actinoplanes rectilineatus TaxID=113571 RepID=UPI0009F89A43|nr:ABC transporter substrate-binding protein [Actinoplanes rectilineatus]